jgi:cytochrome d ubiquinol oxidase subunit II
MLVLAGVTGAVGATAWALRERRFRLARVAAAAQASTILWGWPLAQFPYLLPPHTTIQDAAGPTATLRLVLIALALGALILFPSVAYLFRVFKGKSSGHQVIK